MNRSRRVLAFLIGLICLAADQTARGIDISGVLYAALDQPQINAYVATRPGGPPLQVSDGFGGTTFNITAYYDTGASGILLSYDTFNQLTSPVNRPAETGLSIAHYPTSSGTAVIYQDVGVGGSDSFYVSQPFYLGVAKNSASADVDNFATYSTVYNQTFGPVRAQVAISPPDDPLLEFDLIGTPGMAGKVVVMDPKPVDAFATTGSTDALLSASMQTYVYNPRTPYNAALADSEPGIPPTNRHIRLSSASMTQFTQVTPGGASGPSMANNPFIGPNPVAKMDGMTGDNTPGVTVSFNGQQSTGSFLFDTGAATSMISSQMAARLHVRYVAGTQGTDNPQLETYDPRHPTLAGTPLPNQFQLAVGGVGGSTTAAGFYLDSMLLRTMEANPGNANDPNNLRFLGAPVLVDDVTVQDPLTQKALTLDGVFGVNNWVASTDSTDLTGNLNPSSFNWAVFDQPNNVLGLDVKLDYMGTGVTTFSTWHGDGTAGPNWSSSANWETGKPAVANGLRFTQSAGTTTANFNDFPDGTRFNGLVFSGPSSFNLQGRRIALWGNLINISTAPQTVSLDMELNGSASTFDADSGDIVVKGKISGNQGIVKTGNYKLILSGTGSFTGGLTVSAGEVVVTTPSALPDGLSLTVGDPAAFVSVNVTGTWASAVGGKWSDSSNWVSALAPNGPGQTAVINQPTSTPVAITLDAPQTVGVLEFGNSGSSSTGYTLSGTASSTKLTLNNSGNGAAIEVSDGRHAINAPTVLADNLTVSSVGSNSWTLTFGTASSITETGKRRLTLNATNGKLILSGTGEYTGGTFVTAGTLVLTNPAAIADGTSLTVGDASAFAAAPIVSSNAVPSSVPEPGTIALLAAGTTLLIWRGSRASHRGFGRVQRI